MSGVKSPLQSLTIVAALVAVITSLLGAIGVTVDPDLVSQGVNAGLQLISAAGAAVAIFGRIRATTRIVRATTTS